MNVRPLKKTGMLALLISLAGCQQSEVQPVTPQSVKVETMTVAPERGTVSGEQYSGTVEAENGTPLSFAVAGTVQAVHVKMGQRVKAGQLIATLNPATAQSAYDATRAALDQAEDALRRMKELHDKGSLPAIKWVEVQSQVEQARSAEQIAAKNLRDCRLLAPAGGVIAEKSIETGQNVVPGVAVAQLVSTAQLKVKIAVPETEIAGVSVGQQATVAVPALGGQTFVGRVTEKGVVAQPLSRSYDVKVRVEGQGSELMPGMVTEVNLLPEGADTVQTVLPARIVQLDEHNRTFVWTVVHGKAHRTFVRTGTYGAGGDVEVLSGLKAGDTVILDGTQKVCEGTEVSL